MSMQRGLVISITSQLITRLIDLSMSKLRLGPSNPVPESGRRCGYSNREKLIKHLYHSIELMEHALKHARRSLERAKGERDNSHAHS